MLRVLAGNSGVDMKKHAQATQGKEIRSISQEMDQAFAEWVKKLPFIKKELPKAPDREDPDHKSSEKVSEERNR